MLSFNKLFISVTQYLRHNLGYKKIQVNPKNHVVNKQINQEHISLHSLTAKDFKFGLLRCQAFNRDGCVNFLLIDISKMSVRENYVVF